MATLTPRHGSIHELFRQRKEAEARSSASPKRLKPSSSSRKDTSKSKGTTTTSAKKRKLSKSGLIEFDDISSDDSDIEILDHHRRPIASTSGSSIPTHNRQTPQKKSQPQQKIKTAAPAVVANASVKDTKGKGKAEMTAAIDLTIDEDDTADDEDEDEEEPALPDLNEEDESISIGGQSMSRQASNRSNTTTQSRRESSWGQWNDDTGAHKGEDELFLEPSDDEVEPGFERDDGDEMWGEETMMQDGEADEDDGADVMFADEFDEEPAVGTAPQQSTSKDMERSTSSTNDDDLPICPICSISLASMTKQLRELHVNSCLESDDSEVTTKTGDGGMFSMSSLFGNRSSSSALAKGKGKAVAANPATGRRPLSSLFPSFSIPSKLYSSSSSNSGGHGPNAFTALMTGHAETKAWKEAEAADKQKGRLPKGEFKKVPFYKWIDGLEITVDAFRYNAIEGCKGYFLSHAHSDHYQNLSASWSHGPIYCSLTTANLIKLKLGVKDEWVHALPMNETVKVQGIDVTLIDANHCPGSVVFLFEGPHTDPKSPYSKTPSRIFRYLHCGDFRASPQHVVHPAVKNKRIDICYLDTTYLDSKYCFPAQELVIAACSQLVRERVLEGDEEALNRLAGEAEIGMRKGMKGWLKGGVKKEEEGVKEEEEFRRLKEEKKEEDDDEDVKALRELEEEEEKVKLAEVDNRAQSEGTKLNDVEAKPCIPQDKIKPIDKNAKREDDVEDRKPKVDEDEKKKPKQEKLLVMIGTYSIGKERIVKGIARALQTKIYCDERKSAILTAQDDPELHAMMTSDPLEGQVHMCWLNSVNRDAMSDYHAQYSAKRLEGGYTQVIGLRPTGWTYKAEGLKGEKTPTIAKILERERLRKFSPAGMYPQRDSTSTFLGYGVPYSEHSSFYELTCFALSLDYVRMVPTVNVHTPASRKKMDDWFTRWKAEKKRRADARIPRMVPPRSENYW